MPSGSGWIIPNQSPAFDAQWRDHGYMDQAAELIARWIRAQGVRGLELEVVRHEKRTPLIFVEMPGDAAETVLLYGHLDKQPPLDGWHEGLGPWTPVISSCGRHARLTSNSVTS